MKPAPYEGQEPYLYISYADQDTESVLPILASIQKHGLRFWYPDGTASESELAEIRAQHLDQADVILAFVSPNWVDSATCSSDLNFANSRKKKLLSVMILETQLPLRLELQLSAQHSILRYQKEEDLIKILACSLLQNCTSETSRTPEQFSRTYSASATENESASEKEDYLTDEAQTKEPLLPERSEILPPAEDLSPAEERPHTEASQPKKDAKKTKSRKELVSNRAGLIVAFLLAAVVLIDLCTSIFGKYKKNHNPDSASTNVVVDGVVEETNETQATETKSITETPSVEKVQAADLPKGTPIGYSLEQVGTFEVDTALTVVDDKIGAYLDLTFVLCSVNGEAVLDYFGSLYDSYSAIGNGYYIVERTEDNAPLVGLVSIDGTILISCEAKEICWVYDHNGAADKRYLRVIYAERSGKLSDTRIYDLESRSFVGGTFDYMSYREFWQCGNNLIVTKEDGSGDLLDPAGNVLAHFTNTNGMQIGNGYYVLKDGESQDVYTENAEFCFSSGRRLTAFDSTSGYMCQEADDGYYAVDLTGKQVCDISFDGLLEERYGILHAETKKGTYELRRLNGDLLSTSNYIFYTHGNTATFYKSVYMDTYVVTYNGEANYSFNHTLAMNDLKYRISLKGKTVQVLVEWLLAVRSDETGKYGVVECFDGNTLLDYQYAQIEEVNGYLYCRNQNNWTVYRIDTVRAGME